MTQRVEGASLRDLIALLLHSSEEKGRRFVAGLEIYLDDSGTHHESWFAVAAGYVAHVERWAEFCSAWQALLTETDLPVNPSGIRAFHMVDFCQSEKIPDSPFHLWSETRKLVFFRRAASIVCSIVRDGGGAGVSVTTPIKLYRPSMEGLGGNLRPKPFVMAISALMAEILKWMFNNGKSESEPIVLVVERSNKTAQQIGELVEAIGEVEEAPTFRHVRLAFSSRETDSPLHAADILAYLSFRDAKARARHGETRTPDQYLSLISPSIYSLGELTRGAIDLYSDAVKRREK